MESRIVLVAALVFSLGQRIIPGQAIPSVMPVIPSFPLQAAPTLHISRETDPARPFSVVGPRGALLGRQDGTYEAWIFPWKILSDMSISADMQDYSVPIDVNGCAAWIDVTPAATTVTYSHANFTIQQIMFAPKSAPEGTGVAVLYRIEAIRPMTLTFSFNPAMQRMWPAPSDGHPSPEWVRTQRGADSAKAPGFYILHESLPGHVSALAMPTAEPGILPPYQERPQTWPLQFVLHFDPAKDSGKLFPLLVVLADTPQSAAPDAVAHSLAELDASIPSLYESNAAHFRDLLSSHTSIVTPDAQLNAAFSWAIAAIDQLHVETPSHKDEAFTAGFVGSGDTVRPGFGWFFGRDALWTLYAVNSYGDFHTTQQEIDFLLRHQRADGKIMHEYSQTANEVDWQALPYEYAAADSTPLLLMAMDDYLKISGDVNFVHERWDALSRAWDFETSHVSGDGVYNNTQGTGWVESWVPSMPYQEIYLAELDEQASLAFSDLARATGDANLAANAATRAARIGRAIEQEYFLPGSDFYAFSRNRDGTTDNTPTIFPAVAWWDGTYSLNHSGTMMQRWASSEFSTDWGARILSDKVSFYNPISYHQGSVWPLFTGWLSLAEYRAGQPLAGYASLMQNADLTWSQDLGSVTELLSGQFFQMLGRSTAHQLWSSAMVVTPVLRGIFGLKWNAVSRTITVTPQLPADWNAASVRNVPLGTSSIDLTFTRRGQDWIVNAAGASGIHLDSTVPHSVADGDTLRIPLPAVEVAIPRNLPVSGAITEQMKALYEERTSRSLTLTLAAQGSAEETVYLRENAPGIHVSTGQGSIGPERDGLRPVRVRFPPGEGYVTQTVTFSW